MLLLLVNMVSHSQAFTTAQNGQLKVGVNLSIELSMFGISVKTVAPSATQTDLFSHNSDVKPLPFYDTAEEKMLSMVKPASTPDEIAGVIYEAATDNKDQLRYFAGKSSQAIYDKRI